MPARARDRSCGLESNIASRYDSRMSKRISTAEFRALAELRYRIRRFSKGGDAAARNAGLEPQQYLMLLAIRGLPEGESAKIQTLANQLALKHHSAVELIARLEKRGLARRARGDEDRRQVLVALTQKGHRVLEQVVRQRMVEL